MFHVASGLFFERFDSVAKFGWVRIVKKDDAGLVVFQQEMSPEAWASVVASMCALGENGVTYRAFLAFQRGQ